MKSFIFFQQQYVHFFPLFSLFHLEICQQQNIVPVESHAGSQKKKKCTYGTRLDQSNFSTGPFSSKGGMVKTISFPLGSPLSHPKPAELIRLEERG